MRILVLYNQCGHIIAAVQVEAEGCYPRPIEKDGCTAVELEVPKEMTHLPFVEVCHLLKVDTTGDTLCLIRQESK